MGLRKLQFLLHLLLLLEIHSQFLTVHPLSDASTAVDRTQNPLTGQPEDFPVDQIRCQRRRRHLAAGGGGRGGGGSSGGGKRGGSAGGSPRNRGGGAGDGGNSGDGGRRTPSTTVPRVVPGGRAFLPGGRSSSAGYSNKHGGLGSLFALATVACLAFSY